jgi:hypothetical protein
MRLLLFGFWIERNADPFDRLIRSVGETDGALPATFFVYHFEDQHIEPGFQLLSHDHVLFRHTGPIDKAPVDFFSGQSGRT